VVPEPIRWLAYLLAVIVVFLVAPWMLRMLGVMVG
jgi:hypothetical protein